MSPRLHPRWSRTVGQGGQGHQQSTTDEKKRSTWPGRAGASKAAKSMELLHRADSCCDATPRRTIYDSLGGAANVECHPCGLCKRPLLNRRRRMLQRLGSQRPHFSTMARKLGSCGIAAVFGVDTEALLRIPQGASRSLQCPAEENSIMECFAGSRLSLGSLHRDTWTFAVSCAHTSRLASFRLAGLHPAHAHSLHHPLTHSLPHELSAPCPVPRGRFSGMVCLAAYVRYTSQDCRKPWGTLVPACATGRPHL